MDLPNPFTDRTLGEKIACISEDRRLDSTITEPSCSEMANSIPESDPSI